jgi:hypothetical protein
LTAATGKSIRSRTYDEPRKPVTDRGLARLLLRVPGHVPDHRVRVAAHGVQPGVRVVLRDTPDALALIPECRPGQVLGKERGNPGSGIGVGRLIASLMIKRLVHLVHLVHATDHLFHLVN